MSIYGPSSRKPSLISICAEETGTIISGRYEWSFGNGATSSKSGYTMMVPGKVKMMSLTSQPDSFGNTASVNISIDGVMIKDYGVTILTGDKSAFTNFNVPYFISAGSIINFVSTSNVENNTNASVVALLIELII